MYRDKKSKNIPVVVSATHCSASALMQCTGTGTLCKQCSRLYVVRALLFMLDQRHSGCSMVDRCPRPLVLATGADQAIRALLMPVQG